MARKKTTIERTEEEEEKNENNNIFENEMIEIHKETLPNMREMMNNKNKTNILNNTQKQAIENLAVFVSNHGIALEQTVRDRSKDDPKFSWLYDEQSNGFLYYQYLLKQKEKEKEKEKGKGRPQEKKRKRRRFSSHPSVETNKDTNTNIKSLDKMNLYIEKLENEEKQKKDNRFERSNQMSIFNGGKSHHIGHYLPEDQLNNFNNKYKSYQPLNNQNKGHAMLKKLGWNEGQGLGKNKQGQIKPVSSIINNNNNNNGNNITQKPWDPTPGDNQYDLYKKKMMLSYRYRPNPLGNPRKDYY
eukprot:554759_1